MKVEHTIMTVQLEPREVEMVYRERRKLDDKLREAGIDFLKTFPEMYMLLDNICLCRNNRSHIVNEPLDKYINA